MLIVDTAECGGLKVIKSHTRGITSPTIKREMRRRYAIEPVIGQLKKDGHRERYLATTRVRATLC